jgi:hypothetical protein
MPPNPRRPSIIHVSDIMCFLNVLAGARASTSGSSET